MMPRLHGSGKVTALRSCARARHHSAVSDPNVISFAERFRRSLSVEERQRHIAWVEAQVAAHEARRVADQALAPEALRLRDLRNTAQTLIFTWEMVVQEFSLFDEALDHLLSKLKSLVLSENPTVLQDAITALVAHISDIEPGGPPGGPRPAAAMALPRPK